MGVIDYLSDNVNLPKESGCLCCSLSGGYFYGVVQPKVILRQDCCLTPNARHCYGNPFVFLLPLSPASPIGPCSIGFGLTERFSFSRFALNSNSALYCLVFLVSMPWNVRILSFQQIIHKHFRNNLIIKVRTTFIYSGRDIF